MSSSLDTLVSSNFSMAKDTISAAREVNSCCTRFGLFVMVERVASMSVAYRLLYLDYMYG